MFTVEIIDDDSVTVDMLRDALRLDGIRGVPGSTAVGPSLGNELPDAYLIDLMLKDMSGIELAQELRDQGVVAPIVGMSGSLFLAELARESGVFDAVLEKPFDLDEVLMTLTEAIAV